MDVLEVTDFCPEVLCVSDPGQKTWLPNRFTEFLLSSQSDPTSDWYPEQLSCGDGRLLSFGRSDHHNWWKNWIFGKELLWMSRGRKPITWYISYENLHAGMLNQPWFGAWYRKQRLTWGWNLLLYLESRSIERQNTMKWPKFDPWKNQQRQRGCLLQSKRYQVPARRWGVPDTKFNRLYYQRPARPSLVLAWYDYLLL